MKKIINRIY